MHMRARTHTHRHACVEAPDGMKKRRHRKACKSTGVDTTWTSRSLKSQTIYKKFLKTLISGKQGTAFTQMKAKA